MTAMRWFREARDSDAFWRGWLLGAVIAFVVGIAILVAEVIP